MKKIVLIVLFLLICSVAHAKTYKLLFWYPGEAGTPESAQPVLNLFCDYINEQLKTDKFIGKYENSTQKGLSYIRAERPELVLVSHATYRDNEKLFMGSKPILTTLPYPTKKDIENYFLVSNPSSKDPEANVYGSQPMTQQYVRLQLGWDLPDKINLHTVKDIFSKLKNIGQGKEEGLVILTPVEKYSLNNLNMDWIKNLKVLKVSQDVPAPRIWAFAEPPLGLDNVLTSMSRDEKGRKILYELRLAGFSKTRMNANK